MARKITKEEEEALKLLKGEVKEVREEIKEEKSEKEEKPEIKREEEIFREFIPMIETRAAAPILPFERKGKLEEQIGFEPSASKKSEEKEEIKYSPTFGERGHYERITEEERKLPERTMQVERMNEGRVSRHAPIEMERWHELKQERGIERDMIEPKYETLRPETSTDLPFMKKEELRKYKRR